MYRAVVDGEEPDGGVIVRYIDFSRLVHEEDTVRLYYSTEVKEVEEQILEWAPAVE